MTLQKWLIALLIPFVVNCDLFAQIEYETYPVDREVPCTQRTIPGSTIEKWDWRDPTFSIQVKPSLTPNDTYGEA